MTKRFGEKDVEAVLQRLDHLTREEAWRAATQTLDVVYSLFQNMRVAMGGERAHFTRPSLSVDILPN